jgi:hypothetical protein
VDGMAWRSNSSLAHRSWRDAVAWGGLVVAAWAQGPRKRRPMALDFSREAPFAKHTGAEAAEGRRPRRRLVDVIVFRKASVNVPW